MALNAFKYIFICLRESGWKAAALVFPEHVRSFFLVFLLPLSFNFRNTKEDRYGRKNHIYEQDQTGLINAP